MRPFPKPGPRCERKQRTKVKLHIERKDCIEQETLARATLKKKYNKEVKNYGNQKWQKTTIKINKLFFT
jgi:hypothetical protein